MKSYIIGVWIVAVCTYLICLDANFMDKNTYISIQKHHTSKPSQSRRRLEVDFETGIKELKKYKQEHGDLLVSQGYVVTVKGEEIKLGKWLQRLRQLYKNT